jgi:hypothetical protein
MVTAIARLVGAILGVFLTNVIRIWFKIRTRSERVRDVQTALRAEIRSHRRALDNFLSSQHMETGPVAEPDHRQPPFVPREVEPFVFDAILGDIHILPASTIDPVVLYYRQWRVLMSAIEDIRSPAFASLSAERKEAIHRDYLDLGAFAAELANDALAAINLALGHGEEH